MSSSRRSGGSAFAVNSAFRQSISRPGPFLESPMMIPDPSSLSSSFASSTSYYSSSPTTDFFTRRRTTSPTRVNLHGVSSPPRRPSIRFQIDRSMSPRRSIAAAPRQQIVQRSNGNVQKKTCLCSPTSHPGSFRCALHKNKFGGAGASHSMPYSPNRLNMRRSAMTNSLVRIGTVEGDLVRRALSALIRPSSHQQRRRAGFQPRPSRLSVMSKSEDLL